MGKLPDETISLLGRLGKPSVPVLFLLSCPPFLFFSSYHHLHHLASLDFLKQLQYKIHSSFFFVPQYLIVIEGISNLWIKLFHDRSSWSSALLHVRTSPTSHSYLCIGVDAHSYAYIDPGVDLQIALYFVTFTTFTGSILRCASPWTLLLH